MYNCCMPARSILNIQYSFTHSFGKYLEGVSKGSRSYTQNEGERDGGHPLAQSHLIRANLDFV